MSEKKSSERFEQLSLFSELEKLRGKNLSSDKLADLINELYALKRNQDRIEAEEKRKAAEAEQKGTPGSAYSGSNLHGSAA